MDMFTTLAAAAGISDVNAQVMAEKKTIHRWRQQSGLLDRQDRGA